eukprot:CAMPEP_0114997172 /NCGR_PEP_ID=MMETSP0216-20121206/14748_1 /TAXON_ID=223996 /ORGANISM="Protocruzia adherens, Strain Boccale" /LENGTH=250 /DNA_ID=CAMNT_0002361517 /DNA_START=44 /DNA_END=796 /DNA_ORIENTATION=-
MTGPSKYRKFGSGLKHSRAMMRTMTDQLIQHERITTTHAKAMDLRRFADKMVHWGKRGDHHANVQAMSWLRTPQAVKKLMVELGPRYAQRDGGYTRVVRLGNRKGDNAPMAYVEFIDNPIDTFEKAKKEEEMKGKLTDHEFEAKILLEELEVLEQDNQAAREDYLAAKTEIEGSNEGDIELRLDDLERNYASKVLFFKRQIDTVRYELDILLYKTKKGRLFIEDVSPFEEQLFEINATYRGETGHLTDKN